MPTIKHMLDSNIKFAAWVKFGCFLTLSTLLFCIQKSFAQTITGFNPKSAATGSTITISGNGFNTTAANNGVFFGATKAGVSSAPPTELTVTVPVGAIFAPITVLNISTGFSASSLQFFTPTFSPTKGSITAADIANKLDFATGTMPYAVAMGDFNSDGKPDLVTANAANGPGISVLRNTSTTGTISFASKVEFTTGVQPYSVAVGDLDGDGKLDVATANSFSNTLSVLRNTSSGTGISFAAKVDYTTVANPPAIAIGDINADGKPDLVVVNKVGGDNISVFRNTSTIGTISFAAKVDFAAGANPELYNLHRTAFVCKGI